MQAERICIDRVAYLRLPHRSRPRGDTDALVKTSFWGGMEIHLAYL